MTPPLSKRFTPRAISLDDSASEHEAPQLRQSSSAKRPWRGAVATPRMETSAFDLADRLAAHDALARKERYFRKLIEGGADAFYVTDPIGTVTYRSPGATRLTGWTDEDIIGNDITRFVAPEHLVRARQAIAATMRNPEQSTHVELTLLRKDGTWFDVEATGRNLLDDVDVGGIVIEARDISERKRQQRELEFKNLLLAAQLDTSLDGILVVQETGAIQAVNRRFVEMWGIPDDVIQSRSGERALQFACGLLEAPDAFIRTVNDVRERREPGPSEAIRLKDGRVFDCSCTSMTGAGGERLGRVWYFRDVTERIRAEEALRASEARYRAMFDQAAVGMTQTTVTGVFVTVNPALCSMLGYSESELRGRSFLELTHPDDKTLSEGVRRSLLAAGGAGPGTMEKRYVRKNGSILWAHVTVAAVADAHGQIASFVTVVQDITERKASEDAIRASEASLRAIFDATTDGIAVADPERRRLDAVNNAFCRMLGYTPDEAAALGVSDLHPTDALPSVLAQFERQARGEIAVAMDIPVKRKDGSLFFADISTATAVIGDKRRMVGVFHDVTRRKRAEEELLRLNRSLRLLNEANQALVRADNEPALLNQMTRLIVEVGGYATAWVGLADDDAGRVARPVAQCRQAAAEVESAISSGATESVSLPLRPAPQAESLGVLCIHSSTPHAFDPQELEILEELASDIAYGIASLRTSIERTAGIERLREAMESAVETVAATVEARDPYTAGHQRRVAALAEAIGRELGLDEAVVKGIRFGALIHDVGKIQVPAELLSKPSHLSTIELELIKNHAQAGYDIVQNIEFPWPVAEMIIQHHERLDGSGYPHGLTGDQMILEARILAVADVVEAMSSHRPYRPTIGTSTALAELERGRGSLYDPAAVDACLTLFRRKNFTFQPAGGQPGRRRARRHRRALTGTRPSAADFPWQSTIVDAPPSPPLPDQA